MDRELKSLHIITGAFNLSGGIAAVNRLLIYSLSHHVSLINIFALNEINKKSEREVTSNQCELKYSVFNGNKLKFSASVWTERIAKKYDFVFCDHINLAATLGLLKIISGFEYIAWVHGEEAFPPKPTFEGHIGLKNAAKVLTSSPFTAQVVQQRYPSLRVIPCELALDPIKYPRLMPLDDLINAQGENVWLTSVAGTREVLRKQIILNVARMSKFQNYKGQDTLISAFPIIYASHPGAQLVLCGTGDDYKRIFDIAKTLPDDLQQSIFMPGYVEDNLLNELFRKCYLFTMPSTGEGFGLVYLEAMSFAKPCLGGKLDATPCVVRDGITGVLVDDPTSSQQVAEKLIWLLSNPDAAMTMGISGYELVRTNYMFEHFSKRFLDALAA